MHRQTRVLIKKKLKRSLEILIVRFRLGFEFGFVLFFFVFIQSWFTFDITINRVCNLIVVLFTLKLIKIA